MTEIASPSSQTLPPPMLLVDGTPVVDGLKVYSVATRYGASPGRVDYIIREATVIWANNTMRYFIVRCSKGCETKIKMATGCSIGEDVFYGDIKQAEAVAISKIEAEKNRTAEFIATQQARYAELLTTKPIRE